MVDDEQGEPGPPRVSVPAAETPGSATETLGAAAQDLLAAQSLPRALAARWSAAPGASILHDPENGWRTAADVDRASAAAAATLQSHGLHRGDRLILCAPTSSHFIDVYLGALRMGAVVVLLNPSCSEPEALHIAHDSDPT